MVFILEQQNWRLRWGAQTAMGYFCLPFPSLCLEFVCGILSWFMLRIVFEDLENFIFIRKFCTCTRVSLAYSRVQRTTYAGCSREQSHTVRRFPLYTITYKTKYSNFLVRVLLVPVPL